MFIPKGGSIFTSYTWPHLATKKRRGCLRGGWHFDCVCNRCSDPTELGALTSAVLCKSCSNGYLLNTTPLTFETGDEVWICQNQKCSHKRVGKDIDDLVEQLNRELEATDRKDIKANLAMLERVRKVLHCNHHILTELRTRLIPIVCRQNGIGIDQMPDEMIELKLRLCKENLAVLNIVTPGRSHQRGGVLFECQECIFFIAKRKIEDGRISENEFLKVLKQCQALLNESAKCLTNERPNSVEKYYENSIQVSLKAVNGYVDFFS